MGARHRARELALQFLFQMEMASSTFEEVMDNFFFRQEYDAQTKEFALELIKGTLERIKEIDELIKKKTINWNFDRIAPVDKNVLRMGIYELVYYGKTPPKVAIDEAVELSKTYSTFESGKFVNGILDAIRKDSEIKPQSSKGTEAQS